MILAVLAIQCSPQNREIYLRILKVTSSETGHSYRWDTYEGGDWMLCHILLNRHWRKNLLGDVDLVPSQCFQKNDDDPMDADPRNSAILFSIVYQLLSFNPSLWSGLGNFRTNSSQFRVLLPSLEFFGP